MEFYAISGAKLAIYRGCIPAQYSLSIYGVGDLVVNSGDVTCTDLNPFDDTADIRVNIISVS